MKKFMEPPLYEVHTEVQSECDRGFAYCLLLIYNMSQPSYQWRVPYDRFRARVCFQILYGAVNNWVAYVYVGGN
jgi:hypothetical protein